MRPSPKSIPASAAALVLACGLLGLARTAAQEAQGSGQETHAEPAKAAQQTPSSPAAKAEDANAAAAPAQVSGKSQAPAPARKEAAGPVNTAPPKNLKKVGDHWTPYDPPDPESFPKDATLHIIDRGETLWGLADLTFGIPLLWPLICNENRYICVYNWIYLVQYLLLPV